MIYNFEIYGYDGETELSIFFEAPEDFNMNRFKSFFFREVKDKIIKLKKEKVKDDDDRFSDLIFLLENNPYDALSDKGLKYSEEHPFNLYNYVLSKLISYTEQYHVEFRIISKPFKWFGIHTDILEVARKL